MSGPGRLEIDGREVSAEEAQTVASGFGHFTAMQVRGGRTRGLDLHLQRLEEANREVFDTGLDRDRVRALIRHALGDIADASVRVYVYDGDAELATMVTVKEPGEIRSPQRLLAVSYLRPEAHLKHLATEQGYRSRVARRSGFDDALLTGERGVIAESATANIGFFDDAGVVWPVAPHLRGITMQLLQRHMRGVGLAFRAAPVRLHDVPSYDGAFLSNARGIAVVSGIDEIELPDRPEQMLALLDAYDAVPWDPI